jgi:hypothetical protein
MKKLIVLLFTINYALLPTFAQQWYPMGQGVTNSIGNCFVSTIYEYNNEIVIGGHFKRSASTLLNSIGRWDGYQWQPMSLGAWYQAQPDQKPIIPDLWLHFIIIIPDFIQQEFGKA